MALTGFNHNVRWNEFRTRGTRPAGVNEDAQIKTTTVAGGFRWHQRSGEDCHVTNVDIGLSVDRSRTWVVTGHQSDDLLRHEQGHYDITALGTRELYNRVLQLTAPECSDLSERVQQIQAEIQAEIDEVDDRYDDRTSHGNTASVQQTWEARIRAAKQDPDGTLASLPQ
jgi:predicted secreted Zn-dependent protease